MTQEKRPYLFVFSAFSCGEKEKREKVHELGVTGERAVSKIIAANGPLALWSYDDDVKKLQWKLRLIKFFCCVFFSNCIV